MEDFWRFFGRDSANCKKNAESKYGLPRFCFAESRNDGKLRQILRIVRSAENQILQNL
ncbi:hypothetical protein [Helicobacter sp. 23-1045]